MRERRCLRHQERQHGHREECSEAMGDGMHYLLANRDMRFGGQGHGGLIHSQSVTASWALRSHEFVIARANENNGADLEVNTVVHTVDIREGCTS